MPLTVYPSADLKVVIREDLATIVTGEAARVILLLAVAAGAGAGRLEVLAFDAAVAAVAQRAILFVVVLLAIRVVVDDVEVRGGEWLFTRSAGEACFVPSASQASIGCLDGFAFDDLAAATAEWPHAGAASRRRRGSWRLLRSWRKRRDFLRR